VPVPAYAAAMASNKVEFLEGIYKSWGAGDFRRDPRLPDEFTLVMHAPVPDAGTYAGRDRVAAYMAQFLEPWAQLTIAALEMTERDDTVLVRVLQTGVGDTSGVSAGQQMWNLWTFAEGEPVQMEAFSEEAPAREKFEQA
jgi:ketosteroid isomerase-like protein